MNFQWEIMSRFLKFYFILNNKQGLDYPSTKVIFHRAIIASPLLSVLNHPTSTLIGINNLKFNNEKNKAPSPFIVAVQTLTIKSQTSTCKSSHLSLYLILNQHNFWKMFPWTAFRGTRQATSLSTDVWYTGHFYSQQPRL